MAKIYGNFQTDLTSLRYGSEKPYITKDIGQAPGSQIGLQIQSRIDDTSRITQMFASKPGLKYLLHEAGLRQVQIGQVAKKAEKGNKSIAGAILSKIGNELLSTTQLVGSTLGQVAVNGTGTHFLKGFRTDTYLKPGEIGKELPIPTSFAKFFGEGGVEGAPLALEGETIPVDPNVNVLTQLTPQSGRISPHSLDYVSGVGKPQAINPFGTVVPIEAPKEILFDRKDQSYIKPSGLNSEESKYLDVTDQRKNKDGTSIRKEARIRLGDQGARTSGDKKSNRYWTISGTDAKSSDEVDQINLLDVFDSTTENPKPDGTTDGRDLIKFRFHVITPDSTRILYFRAFLDSFADNYSGAWNPVKYLGRAEDFQIYSGFQRKITLSFKIAAATRSEMKPLYRKMVYLASATAPSYADSGQFMRGTIVKLTLGDYVYELPGVLNSCNFTWNTDYPWEIALTEPEDSGKDTNEQELPMVLDCSIDFTPIHNFTPETGLKKYFTTGLNNGGEGEANGFFKDIPELGGDPIKTEKLNKAAADEKATADKANAEKQAAVRKQATLASNEEFLAGMREDVKSQEQENIMRTNSIHKYDERNRV